MGFRSPLDYDAYRAAFLAHASQADISEYGAVHEGGRDYPLLRAVVPGEPTVLITSGFHGEEQAGPITLLEHLPEIAERARRRGVGLWVYPCVNPSGFEAGHRYNMSGEHPNNDFLRYEVAPGVWEGILTPPDAPFLRWELYDGGPKETRALRQELQRFAASPPRAALDIHQDAWMRGAFCYAYIFGEHTDYHPIVEACEAHVHVARSERVGDHAVTDADGLVVLHDGSISDWLTRIGVPWTAALETSTDTPLALAKQVNLRWIEAFIDFAAQPVAALAA